ncbi:MAG: C4-type zinc ribbon domain-containing protein [Candidatus Omnitrophota bacterium]
MTENVSYKVQLEKLIQLQKIDSEAFDLKVRKESFPAKIKELDDSFEQKKAFMEAAEEELTKSLLAKNGKERELQESDEKIKKLEGNLYQIKTNREYTALKHEIDSLKADASLIEEEIIALFDKIDSAKETTDREKKNFELEKENEEKEKAVIKSEEKKLSDELNVLIAKREEYIGAISADVFNSYKRILENRGRTALAEVKNSFCSECNMQLRPQVVNEATLKKSVVFCENCGRILYAEGQTA